MSSGGRSSAAANPKTAFHLAPNRKSNRIKVAFGALRTVPAVSIRTADAMTMTSVPAWDRQFGLVRVHHEHCEELRRLRLAGIGADGVAVAGQFGEALSGLVGRHRSVVDPDCGSPPQERSRR